MGQSISEEDLEFLGYTLQRSDLIKLRSMKYALTTTGVLLLFWLLW